MRKAIGQKEKSMSIIVKSAEELNQILDNYTDTSITPAPNPNHLVFSENDVSDYLATNPLTDEERVMARLYKLITPVEPAIKPATLEPEILKDLSAEEKKQLAELKDPDSPDGIQEQAEQAEENLDYVNDINVAWILTHDLETTKAIAGHISGRMLYNEVYSMVATIALEHFKQYKEIAPREAIEQGIVLKAKDKPKEIKEDYLKRYQEIAKARPANYTADQVIKWAKVKATKVVMNRALENNKNGVLDIVKLKDELNTIEAIGNKSKDKQRAFQDGNAILTLPDPTWLIEGLAPENSFGLIYGMPGSYKTFFALDMALSIAHGLPFLDTFNIPVAYPVAYISPEGSAGLKHRLKEWMNKHHIDKLDNVLVNRDAFRLNETEEVEAVISQIMATGIKPKVLFIDTMARNFGSGDENSTKDMSAFVNNVLDISSRLNLGVIVVHHTGKNLDKGPRGSISLTGAMDFSISLEREEGSPVATVRCAKQKDAAEFTAFNIRATSSGQSLTLSYDGIAPDKQELKKELTANDMMPVLCALPIEEAEAITQKEVESITGLPYTTTVRYLDKLVKHAWANKLKGRPMKYHLTYEGKSILDKVNMANLAEHAK